jgi:tetraacyldisaccharide 4'-kinase
MRPPAFWNIREGRDAVPFLRALLTPLGLVYAASVARRLERAQPVDLGVPVVSIGNISLGGTGKTPLARAIRARLSQLLARPVAVVSRGYGGTLKGPVEVDTARHTAAEVGDEPLMLAHDGPVFIGADRAEAAQLAKAAGAGALVLDDAHQNPSLRKSFSFVVVDGEVGFGNRHIVPAGPLREPIARGLARADAVILMGVACEDTLEDLQGFDRPILSAHLKPVACTLEGPVLAFCGIGRPEKFEDTIRALGLDLAELLPFPDHYPFKPADIARLRLRAREIGATLVTTEKDFARLPLALRDWIEVIKVEAVFDDQAALDDLLRHALAVLPHAP